MRSWRNSELQAVRLGRANLRMQAMRPKTVVFARVPGAAQHGAKRNDALQTPISGLPEIGTQICASRVNPTCVDSYAHRLRDGPGPAVHRFAIARAAPHPGHVTPCLSAYGVKPGHDEPGIPRP